MTYVNNKNLLATIYIFIIKFFICYNESQCKVYILDNPRFIVVALQIWLILLYLFYKCIAYSEKYVLGVERNVRNRCRR